MLFNSFIFLFAFLPMALGGFYLAARIGRRAACIWLIGASVVFYGWERPDFVPVLLLSMGGNFLISRLIARCADRPRLQDWVLGLGIAANLGMLFRFKYLTFALTTLGGIGLWHGPIGHVTLPLGISFFTFTQIGFLVDFKQGVAKERGLLSYLLFVSFFPHLIAGPILHNREMMPQFANPATYRLRLDNLAAGSSIFIIGLFKKCLLADPLSPTVIAGFAHPGDLALFSAWHVALAYSLQLYFDFSGYSDMAIGLARMFNVRFPLNFNSPYKAASVIDYWQRWHMTLTRYLTLYVYNPIALWVTRRRQQRGVTSTRKDQATIAGFAEMIALPTAVTILLAGVWHGAGWQFLIFGLLHTIYLIVNHAWRMRRARRGAKLDVARSPVWAVALTYLCALVASIFFRAPSSGAAFALLLGMVGTHGLDPWPPVHALLTGSAPRAELRPLADMLWLAALYAIVWLAPNSQQIMCRCDPVLGKVQAPAWTWLQWRPDWRWGLAGGFAAALAVLAIGGTSEFLYFQF